MKLTQLNLNVTTKLAALVIGLPSIALAFYFLCKQEGKTEEGIYNDLF